MSEQESIHEVLADMRRIGLQGAMIDVWKRAVEAAERMELEISDRKRMNFIHSRQALTGRLPQAYTDEELVKMFRPWWEERSTDGLSPREVRLLETIVDRSLHLAERTLTCAFCGQTFPEGTPATRDARLTEHVKVCEKHPIRAFERDRNRLIEFLETLTGKPKTDLASSLGLETTS